MPELPEVEVVRRGLQAHVVGKTITAVRVHHPRAVRRHEARRLVIAKQPRRLGGGNRLDQMGDKAGLVGALPIGLAPIAAQRDSPQAVGRAQLFHQLIA